jgi:hypothetical protein
MEAKKRADLRIFLSSSEKNYLRFSRADCWPFLSEEKVDLRFCSVVEWNFCFPMRSRSMV